MNFKVLNKLSLLPLPSLKFYYLFLRYVIIKEFYVGGKYD